MSRTKNRIRRVILLAACALAGTVARAQDPVLVPGLPGARLPAGELPPLPSSFLDEPIESLRPVAPDLESESTGFGVTGDWFGLREALRSEGVTLRTNFTQFYQGVTTGGLRERFRYGVKFDYFGVIEAEPLFGWKGLYVNLHGESRFGQSINRDEGAFLPANFALEFPQNFGSASAITNLQLAQYLTPEWCLFAGKINTPDGVNIHPFYGGYGTDRFMNMGFVINPIYGRTLPYSTPGLGVSYLRELDPIFTAMVVDSIGSPDTSGLANLFQNGATLFAQLRVPVEPFGMRGHHAFEGTYSSGRFATLSPDDYVILPDSRTRPGLETGSWVLIYGYDQLLILDQDRRDKGFGVFCSASLSDGNPNPIHWFLNAGIAGTSPFAARPSDTMGLGYYYLGVSSALEQTLRASSPIRNEQGFEFYYNCAITRWFDLSVNIQAVDPAQLQAESSLIFGLRGRIVF